MQIKTEAPAPLHSPSKPKVADVGPKTPVKAARSSPVKTPRRQNKLAGSSAVVGVHPVPTPENLQEPGEGEHIQGYYLVTVGRECGIFFTWHDSHDRTNELSGACHRRCKTWQQAVDGYRKAYAAGDVKALPDPGTKYWTTPVAAASPRARVGRPSGSSDELYWDRLEDNEQELGADELSAYLSAVTLQDW